MRDDDDDFPSGGRVAKSPKQFVMSCFQQALCDPIVHNRWVSADMLLQFINERFSVLPSIQFDRSIMVRHVNKLFPGNFKQSLSPIQMNLPNGQTVDIIRYEFHLKGSKKLPAFYVRETAANKRVMPSRPPQKLDQAWMDEHVYKPLVPIVQDSHETELPQTSTANAINESSVGDDATEKPAADEATEKPADDEATEKPAADEATEKPAADEAPKKPAAAEATKKPAAKAATKRPSEAKKATKKPAAKEATSSPTKRRKR